MEKCTILVNSCDKYEDAWYPLFKIMKAEWKDRKWPIVLNTESKTFDYEDMGIKTFRLYQPGVKDKWGKRLIETLKRIDTEYVLMYLDDFFLTRPVNQNMLDQCIEWLDKNDDVAVFCFMPAYGENIKDGRFEGFEKRPQDGDYRLNCQAALWRKEELIEYTKPNYNPWEWEIFGSIRTRKSKKSYYSIIKGVELPFEYQLSEGTGIYRGRWVDKVVIPIFKKHDINIDFSIRGIEKEPFNNKSKERTFFRKVKDRIMYICAKYF